MSAGEVVGGAVVVYLVISGVAVIWGLFFGAMEATTDTDWEDINLFNAPIKKIFFVWGLAVAITFWLFGGFRKN